MEFATPRNYESQQEPEAFRSCGSRFPIPCESSLSFEVLNRVFRCVYTIGSRFSTLPASLGSSAVATSEAVVPGFRCTYVVFFFQN